MSGFKDRRISRAGLRELKDGIELLPCIRSLNLSNNAITDDFDKEVLEIFDLTKIKAIDLSFNHMKQLGMQIGRKLRDEITHISWIDLTMNDFDKYYEEDTKPIKEGENRNGRIGRDARDPKDA